MHKSKWYVKQSLKFFFMNAITKKTMFNFHKPQYLNTSYLNQLYKIWNLVLEDKKINLGP